VALNSEFSIGEVEPSNIKLRVNPTLPDPQPDGQKSDRSERDTSSAPFVVKLLFTGSKMRFVCRKPNPPSPDEEEAENPKF
jgi:hypothetical protein